MRRKPFANLLKKHAQAYGIFFLHYWYYKFISEMDAMKTGATCQ